MDISKVAQETLQELSDNGTVKAIISKQIEKTVTDIVNDTMREYSDFGRKLKETIAAALSIDFANLKLEDYNAIVCKVVTDTLKGTAHADTVAQIERNITAIVGDLNKSEYKLSEIIEKYKSTLSNHEDVDCVELEVEQSSYGSIWVRIGRPGSGYSKSSVTEFRLLLDEKTKTLSAYWVEGVLKTGMMGKMFNVTDALLFRIWATQSTIDLNQEECELYLENRYQD